MISITQWRAEIGSFYCKYQTRFKRKSPGGSYYSVLLILSILLTIEFLFLDFVVLRNLFDELLSNFFANFFNIILKISIKMRSHPKITFPSFLLLYSFFFILTIIQSGDIELNPGPASLWCNLSICHWNLNSLKAHNFSKVSLLEAYNSNHNFDIICLSETLLDSSIDSEDPCLAINRYTLVRADHPDDIKRGGVCIYYKSCLPLRVLNISKLNECLILELKLKRKTIVLSTLYRSPSQTADEFESFMKNFEVNLNSMMSKKPFLTCVLGDFNTKSSSWFKNDKSSTEGLQIDSLTSYYGLSQIMNEATHILPNSSSCIDLIFTSQPNLVTHSGVHSSLHENCHHQLTFAKFDLRIEYPPPYERLVWNYNEAETSLIHRAIKEFDWEKAFAGLDIDKKVELFNETILNIFSNYCPNKVITCNDKDPPWLTVEIKTLIKKKNLLFKKFSGSKSETILSQLTSFSNKLAEMILSSKEKYYNNLGSKLNNPLTKTKTYWSILKTLLNGRKIPLIPPILVGDKFITNFSEKATLFNEYFAKQCTLIENSSQIPDQDIF